MYVRILNIKSTKVHLSNQIIDLQKTSKNILPIVVTTVLEKKNDCPKLQEGTAEPFFSKLTPRLLALTISSIKSSREESIYK